MALATWLLLAGVVAFVLFRGKEKRQASKGEKLPPVVGGGLPFLGSIFRFARAPVQSIIDAAQNLGDVFTLKLVGYNMTFLVSPEAHAVFFRAGDDEVSPKEAYRFMVPVFGRGVVYDSPTHIMYEQLKFVRSGLSVKALQRSVPKIINQANAYLSAWGEKGQVDLLEAMNQTTILTASRCLLGKEVNDNPKVSAEFAHLFHVLEKSTSAISFFYPYLPIPAHRERDKARVEVSSLFKDVLSKRRAGEPQDDMMQSLMDARYKGGEQLDDDKICGLLVGLLFAGQHTSGITTTWTLLNLTHKPEFMTKVLREQQELLSKYDGQITYESIRDSEVLESCVRESLRMFPPLIHLMRKVLKPLHYKGYTIPAGDLVCISPGAAMRLDSSYPDADVWNPDRLTKDKLQADVADYKYVAFGGGRHGCPGEVFGILQIKTILTILLRNYEFTSVGKLPSPDYSTLVVGPKHPCMIEYKRRDADNHIEKLKL